MNNKSIAFQELLAKLKLLLLVLRLQLKVLMLKEKLTIPNLKNPKHIVLHHGGGDWSFSKVDNHHTNLWGFKSSLGYGLGYHYWISYDGKVTQARRDNERAAHCVESGNPNYWNLNSIGICCRGNEKDITSAQLGALNSLVEALSMKYNINKANIFGHRNMKPTSCPGDIIYNWLSGYKRSIKN